MTPKETEISHKRVLAISFPLIFSNVSEPLLGLVDTAVIGRLDDEVYLGAIALGAMIISFLYWGFGSLRMSTTGFVAQSHGNADYDELKATMARALLIALGLGLAVVFLQFPISELAFRLISGSDEVERLARDYFTIRIWSAPMTLINYACLGYLIGMGRTGTALMLQIVLNGTNIFLDILFVMGFGWDVQGVALGTALSETVSATAGLILIYRHLNSLPGELDWNRVTDKKRTLAMLSVNGDIFIRTISLLFAFSFFTAQGAKAGNLVLAANAILIQFFNFMAYSLDGFANAAEVLVGNAVGRRNRHDLQRAVRVTTQWAIIVSLLFSLFFFLLGPLVIDLLTTLDEVRVMTKDYLVWMVAMPVIAIWCFQLDGIFAGATQTRPMRNAMVMSVIAYLVGWYVLQPLGNNGLWAAMAIFVGARGLTLAVYYPGLVRDKTDALAAA